MRTFAHTLLHSAWILALAPLAAPAGEPMPFLGVATAKVDPVLAAHLNLPAGFGLVVRDVAQDTPAASVLREHDVLVLYGDQRLTSPEQLGALAASGKVGDAVKVGWIRGGQRLQAPIALAPRPDEPSAPPVSVEGLAGMPELQRFFQSGNAAWEQGLEQQQQAMQSFQQEVQSAMREAGESSSRTSGENAMDKPSKPTIRIRLPSGGCP